MRPTLDVLPELTKANLLTLGLPLGLRRKLLKSDRKAALRRSPIARYRRFPKEPGSAPLSGAGRRQLTVMFCDLLGSTALSARLDPEDLRAVIGASYHCCAPVIERSDGFMSRETMARIADAGASFNPILRLRAR
jgi:class 3 adenylate cyclase